MSLILEFRRLRAADCCRTTAKHWDTAPWHVGQQMLRGICADKDILSTQIDITRSMQNTPGVIRLHGVYEVRRRQLVSPTTKCSGCNLRAIGSVGDSPKLTVPPPLAGREKCVHRDRALPRGGPGAAPQSERPLRCLVPSPSLSCIPG